MVNVDDTETGKNRKEISLLTSQKEKTASDDVFDTAAQRSSNASANFAAKLAKVTA